MDDAIALCTTWSSHKCSSKDYSCKLYDCIGELHVILQGERSWDHSAPGVVLRLFRFEPREEYWLGKYHIWGPWLSCLLQLYRVAPFVSGGWVHVWCIKHVLAFPDAPYRMIRSGDVTITSLRSRASNISHLVRDLKLLNECTDMPQNA
eukprot:621503-Prymnesium_polylepis.1